MNRNRQKRKAEKRFVSSAQDLLDAEIDAKDPKEARLLRKLAKRSRSKAQRRIGKIICGDFQRN
jgi:hypothetical protein